MSPSVDVFSVFAFSDSDVVVDLRTREAMALTLRFSNCFDL